MGKKCQRCGSCKSSPWWAPERIASLPPAEKRQVLERFKKLEDEMRVKREQYFAMMEERNMNSSLTTTLTTATNEATATLHSHASDLLLDPTHDDSRIQHDNLAVSSSQDAKMPQAQVRYNKKAEPADGSTPVVEHEHESEEEELSETPLAHISLLEPRKGNLVSEESRAVNLSESAGDLPNPNAKHQEPHTTADQGIMSASLQPAPHQHSKVDHSFEQPDIPNDSHGKDVGDTEVETQETMVLGEDDDLDDFMDTQVEPRKAQLKTEQLTASPDRVDSKKVKDTRPEPVVKDTSVQNQHLDKSLHQHPSSRPADSTAQNERNVSPAVGSPGQGLPKHADVLESDTPSGKHYPAWERPLTNTEDSDHHSNDMRPSFGTVIASQSEIETGSHQHPLPDPTFECDECKQLKIKIRQTEEGIQALKSALAARETTIMELRTKKQATRAEQIAILKQEIFSLKVTCDYLFNKLQQVESKP